MKLLMLKSFLKKLLENVMFESLNGALNLGVGKACFSPSGFISLLPVQSLHKFAIGFTF